MCLGVLLLLFALLLLLLSFNLFWFEFVGLLKSGVDIFLQFWKILGHYLFEYLFCHIFLSFLSETPICMPIRFFTESYLSLVLFFFTLHYFFPLCFSLEIFFWPSFNSPILFYAILYLLVNPSNEFLFTFSVFFNGSLLLIPVLR